MSSNYVFRLIKESPQGSYTPTGVWIEVRHTNSTLTASIGNTKVNGLSMHKGYTDAYRDSEVVSGDISLINTKEDLDFFMSIFTGTSKIGDTYDIGDANLQTVTIEQYDVDLDKTILYRDVAVKSIRLAFSFGSMSGLTVSFLGGYYETSDTRPSDLGTVVKGSSSGSVAVHEDISLYLADVEIPLFIRSGDILLDNEVQTIEPLGGNYAKPFGVGHILPSGSITIYSDLESFKVYKARMDAEDFKVVFKNTEFELTVYKIYIGGNLPVDRGINTEVDINLDFEGVYDTTTKLIYSIKFL